MKNIILIIKEILLKMRYKKLEWNEGEQIGDKYYGGLKHELLDGEGVYIWGNGRKYIGSYKNGVKQGRGTFFWPEYGDQYTGEWLNDEFHGQGTYIWGHGDRYVGSWYDGKKNGMGIEYSSVGSIIREGFYKEDEFEFEKKFRKK